MPTGATEPPKRTGSGQRRRVHWGHVALLVVGVGCIVGGLKVGWIFKDAFQSMPALGNPMEAAQKEASAIYAKENGTWVKITDVPGSTVNRQTVALNDIPTVVQHAFVAIEDRNFYANDGIDLRSIVRAAINDAEGRPLQGASTITEQLARNLYLTQQRTLVRKVKEAWLGLELARMYTKNQILDMYLNLIYLGSGSYGVGAASETYFGTSIQNVTLPEAALLAGMTQDPNGYNPFNHPKAAEARRNTVLAVMAKLGYITQAQATAAESAPIALTNRPTTSATTTSYPDPWYVDEVITQLETTFHLSSEQVLDGGLKIYTAMDPRIQNAAQTVVNSLTTMSAGAACNPGRPCQLPGIWSLSVPSSDQLQVALSMINPLNGNVVAIIGGRQHTTELQLDLAVQGEFQTGSAMKPLVDYIPALDDGYTAGTTVDDVAKAYDMGPGQPLYVPTNYNNLYYGLTTFTEGLRRSVNVMAVKVLEKVGVQNGYENAIKMGLPLAKADDHLSLALGGTDGVDCCSTLDMATAYAAIDNGGTRVTPRFIEKVVAPDGRVLVNNPPQLTPDVVSPQVAYVMTKMLETVDSPEPYGYGWDVNTGPLDSNWGTGYDVQVDDKVPGWPSAAKTGTTNNGDGLWYVGYTPLYSEAVWVGYEQPKTVMGADNRGGEGDIYAGPVWKWVMEAALAGKSVVHFHEPPGIVDANIDIKSPAWTVTKPGPLTPAQYIRESWFVAGTQPTQINPLWEQVQVDSNDPNLLWGVGCPYPPETKVFLNRTPVGMSFADTMAKDTGKYPASQFIPIDMSLAPPTQYCGQPLPATSTTTVSSSTAKAPAATASSWNIFSCQSAWAVTVEPTADFNPTAICIPLGSEATIYVRSTDGKAYTVGLSGYGVQATVPASEVPAVLQFQANQAGNFVLQDESDPSLSLEVTVLGK